MEDRLKPGDIIQNFKRETVEPGTKQYLYRLKAYARHSETGERMAVYEALYPPYGVWVRPYDMFAGRVDKIKYPEIRQEYRFEKAESGKEEAVITEEKMKVLVVVDMQADFVTGSLGSAEARAIVPYVEKRIQKFQKENPNGRLIFTMDTHNSDYLTTQEGKKLPVEHCIKDTEGWELIPELKVFSQFSYEKETFGSIKLAETIAASQKEIESVELLGVCTDICVISNALLIKAHCPELPIYVRASCCAGVTPEKHEAAIETMKSCQIGVIEELV